MTQSPSLTTVPPLALVALAPKSDGIAVGVPIVGQQRRNGDRHAIGRVRSQGVRAGHGRRVDQLRHEDLSADGKIPVPGVLGLDRVQAVVEVRDACNWPCRRSGRTGAPALVPSILNCTVPVGVPAPGGDDVERET